MKKLVDGRLLDMTEAEVAQHEADAAAWREREAPPRMIAKTALYRRASDTELAALDAFLATQATTRQRLMWQDAEGGLVYVREVAPLAEALFGAERAAELLS